MKKFQLIVLLAVMINILSCDNKESVQVDTNWPVVETQHKPFSRWWWLGNAVDERNLTANLESMAKAGIGGVEITPIYGVIGNEANDIDFLSPRWMEVYKHTVNEAHRLGMEVDLNMGTGWPFGGPDISIEDAATMVIIQKYELKGGEMLVEKIEPANQRNQRQAANNQRQAEGVTLSVVMAFSDKGEKLNITDKVNAESNLIWTAPAGEWTIYAAFNGKTRQAVKRAAPGGEGLVMDHLSRTAFDTYAKRFSDAFTPDIPRPRYFFNDSYEVSNSTWTPTFLEEFAKRRGYKFEEYIPEYIANDESEISRRVISDYRQTINDLLLNNFIYPWRDWVHAHGSKVRNQSHGSPGNIIDIYGAVDVPEPEIFGRTIFDIPNLRQDAIIKYNDSNPTVLKFASSAANLTGRKYVTCETFTWLTEHFRTALSQCKPELDLVLASGVNHVIFHGTTYSPAEAEWPGWMFYASVNMSPTNPQWEDASGLFQYIARAQSFLQMGTADNEILLYFPIYDYWNERGNQYMTFSIHGLEEKIKAFNKSVIDIRNAGYNPDYISDDFIKALKVKNGNLYTAAGVEYKALVVPNAQVMPAYTLEKLITLAKGGATILFEGGYPSDIPGLQQADKRKAELAKMVASLPQGGFSGSNKAKMSKGTIITGNDYGKMLSAAGITAESFANDFEGVYIRRAYNGGNIYFLALLKNKPIDSWVTLGKNAESVMIFDPMTGSKGLARTKTENGKTMVYLQLKAGQSVILKTYTTKVENEILWSYYEPTNEVIHIEAGWQVSFLKSEPAITGEFFIDRLGSWTDLKVPEASVNMGTASYLTYFKMPEGKAAQWRLDLGRVAESARVIINKQYVATLWAPPFSIDIAEYLKADSTNEIEVQVTNLPANRIADYCRRGIVWRKFKDANVVSIAYGPISFENWEVEPSGLLGPVTLTKMNTVNP